MSKNKIIIFVIVCVLLAFVSASLVAPYFIDYYYGSQPAHTISESLNSEDVVVIEGNIWEERGKIWIIDNESNYVELSNDYNLELPLSYSAVLPSPKEYVKAIGYFYKTQEFGVGGIGYYYKFVPKKILKE